VIRLARFFKVGHPGEGIESGESTDSKALAHTAIRAQFLAPAIARIEYIEGVNMKSQPYRVTV
jgi:hypothetical protein